MSDTNPRIAYTRQALLAGPEKETGILEAGINDYANRINAVIGVTPARDLPLTIIALEHAVCFFKEKMTPEERDFYTKLSADVTRYSVADYFKKGARRKNEDQPK